MKMYYREDPKQSPTVKMKCSREPEAGSPDSQEDPEPNIGEKVFERTPKPASSTAKRRPRALQ